MNRLFGILNEKARIKFENQNFKDKFGNQDWRKYIPKQAQKEFARYTKGVKKAYFIMAEIQARTEPYREPAKPKITDLLPQGARTKLKNRSKTNRARAKDE